MVKEIYVEDIIGDIFKEVMSSMSGQYKTCKKCKRSLPLNKKYFNENASSKDGY